MKGEENLKAAEKKANAKPGLFGITFGRADQKYEDAYELCQEALQIFKMNKKWDRAAVASMQGAKMQELLGVKHEAASCFIEAYKMMKKVDAKAAIEPLEKAVMLFASLSRFQFASKWSLEIGEIYEKDVGDLKKAIEFYENAVQYAEMSGEDSSRNKAEVKVATLAAVDEQYQKALELFEVIADRMVDNNLLKFSCKEYYLKAGLCSLCLGDVVGAKVKHERYESQAAYFRDSRESKLLINLAEALENEDQEEFTQVVKEYDAVSKLDGWMTQILLKIKKGLAGEDLL